MTETEATHTEAENGGVNAWGIIAALARFQASLPEIAKTRTARIAGKEGKQGYEYEYADLADVAAAVLPALGAVGICYTGEIQQVGQGGLLLVCKLRHTSGDEIESFWPLPDSRDAKALGSALTYGRRYCLLTMTGVHPAGEDDDGDAAGRGNYGGTTRGGHEEQVPAKKSPATEVIEMGRSAGLDDGAIKLDLDEVARGRPHADLTSDELRQVWMIYRDIAKAKQLNEAEDAKSDAKPVVVPAEGTFDKIETEVVEAALLGSTDPDLHEIEGTDNAERPAAQIAYGKTVEQARADLEEQVAASRAAKAELDTDFEQAKQDGLAKAERQFADPREAARAAAKGKKP